MVKFYPSKEEETLCISCYYARMRTDICGIYCTKGFVKDGKCEKYKKYREKNVREEIKEEDGKWWEENTRAKQEKQDEIC